MALENQPGFAAQGLERSTVPEFGRIVLLGITGVAAISLAGLLGNVSGLWVLASIRPDYVPMEPSTAGCFLMLSLALLGRVRRVWEDAGLKVTISLGLFAALFILLAAAGLSSGRSLVFENRLFPAAGMFGGIPIARMSPASGAVLAVAGLGVFLLLLWPQHFRPGNRFGDWASSLGALTLLAGMTVLLSYAQGTPLLYGGAATPMAATTSLAFVLLGITMMAAAGPDSFPVSRLVGRSTSARLARTMIPLTVALVLVQSTLPKFVPAFYAVNSALFLAFLAVAAAAILAVAAGFAAHSIGRELDDTNRTLNRTLDALRKSEERLRMTAEAGNIGLWDWDLSTNRVHYSPVWKRQIGFEDHEITDDLGEWQDRVHPDDLDAAVARIRGFLSAPYPGYENEFRFRHKDGSHRTILTRASILQDESGRPVHMLGAHIDITDLRHAEQQIQYQATLLNHVADAVLATDRQFNIQYWNAAAEEQYGWTQAEVVGQHFLRFIKPQFVLEPRRSVMRTIAQRGYWKGELLHNRRNGTLFPVQVTISEVRTAEGRVLGHVAINRDITQNKQAEKALRESEAQYRQLFERDSDALLVLDAETNRLEDVNPAALRLYGYTREEFLALSAEDISVEPDETRAAIFESTAGDSEHHVYRRDHRRRDGTMFPVEATYGGFLADCRRKLIVAVRDITARRQAEEERTALEAQLQQAQRMESVGRLAGGVAHDFNNMLAVILGHMELALSKVNPAEPLHADLEEVRTAATRSADLTRQLLAFARRQTVAPRVLDLNDTVAGTLKMLQRLLGENIRLGWHPSAGLWPVYMDPSQIDQILANLCLNARDAIAEVGTLSIETSNRIVDDACCANHADALPGEYVQLSVSDSGCGMDKETLAQIFEPFFTTKEVGKGTGLGLATVYGAVRQNGGFVTVQSEPGRGTTFTVCLPRHANDAEQRRTADAPPPAAPRGEETILLVEDEPSLLRLTAMLLKGQGYTVLATASAKDALRLAEKHPGDIHLLMTDVVMPEMNGDNLANRLASSCPSLKCLFMSGYTADVIAHHGILGKGVHFIQKPFSTLHLAAKIREVLNSE